MYKVYVPVKHNSSVAIALQYDPALDLATLRRELKYYFNEREKACYYQPYGESLVRYDERLTLTVCNDRDTIRVLRAVCA
jgi:hypothetical protein